MKNPSEKIKHHTLRQRAQIAESKLKELFEYYLFTKKQKKLLCALARLRPIPVPELEFKTKSKNIKSLVRDTNKRLKWHRLYPQIKIISCINKFGLKEHYYLIFSPLSD